MMDGHLHLRHQHDTQSLLRSGGQSLATMGLALSLLQGGILVAYMVFTVVKVSELEK